MGKNDDKTLQGRLWKVVETLSDGNLKAFCEKYGLKYTSWLSVLNEHGNPRSEMLIQFIDATEVNPTWLINGRQAMFEKHDKSLQAFVSQHVVPYYDIHATAGQVTLPNQDMKEVPAGYIDLPNFADCDFAIPVRGNSMSTYIQNGDIILCKKYDKTGYISFGNTFVIVTKQECLLKYIRKGRDEEHVMLVSENKAEYDPFEIRRDEIEHLHIVKGIIRQATF